MTRRMLAIAGLALLAAAGSADHALAQFYKGKTLTMIINYPAGGPNDIEGRIIAQHLPNHIPGKPTVVVKNVERGRRHHRHQCAQRFPRRMARPWASSRRTWLPTS